MSEKNWTQIWVPGRRAAKAERRVIASVIICLTLMGGISQLLPGLVSAFAAFAATPPGTSEPQQTNPSIPATTSSLDQRSPTSLSPGTVHYGSRASPTVSQVADSSIPPLLTSTPTAFVYQTSFGQYSFSHIFPFIFNLTSVSGRPLTKQSFFFVRSSSAELTPGSSNVTLAADNEFQVRYEVLLNNTIVGHLVLQVDFNTSSRPKFTISFSETSAWSLGDFNIVWSTFTVHEWLKTADSPTLNIQSLTSELVRREVARADVGPSNDPSTWTDWVTTDWTDSAGASLAVGPHSLGQLSGSGLKVVFPIDKAIIDPTQVASTTSGLATGVSTQRKTFSFGNYYFLFWYNGANIVYSTSLNGVNWSPAISTGSGYISYSFDLSNLGSFVALAWLDYSSSVGGDGASHLLFKKGTVNGNSINWDPTRTVASLPQPYTWPPSVAIGTDGTYWASGVWYDSPTSTTYYDWVYHSTDGVSFSLSTNYVASDSGTCSSSRDEAIQLIALSQGRLLVLLSHYCNSTIRWAVWNPITASSSPWNSIQSYNLGLPTYTAKLNLLSAAMTPDGQVHLIYVTSSQVYEAIYDPTSNSVGTFGGALYSGSALYPSITTDSLGNQYTFWMTLSAGVPSSLMFSVRQPRGVWSTPSTPFGSGSAITNANWLSATRVAQKELFLTWTNTGASPFQIFYGSILLPAGVASAPPSQPWSKLGLSSSSAPGEYVSPGNGLLAIGQTDISSSGRNGLALSISRLYLQPFTFLQGVPFNYETSPYANLGNGWLLNLPWVGTQYLHYLNGEVFPLVWTFPSSVTGLNPIVWTMENHQGEDFILTKTTPQFPSGPGIPYYTLTVKDGTVFNFNSGGVLTSIVDRTGQNQLVYNYGTNGFLASINDAIGRTATLNYDSNNRLISANYAGQTITYGYSGSNLATVTDLLGNAMTFQYSSQNSWLLSGVVYPTGGRSSYTYGSVNVGTESVNFYVTLQNLYATSLVRSTSFSYQITDGTITYASLTQSNSTVVQGYTNFQFSPQSKSSTVITLDSNQVQMRKTVSWFDANGRMVQQDVYNGNSPTRSSYTRTSYDTWGNIVYTRDALGHESFASYANTDSQYSFQGPGSLTTTTDGKKLFDDFNTPTLDATTWNLGGNAISNNLLSNPGFETGDFSGWSQTNMVIRADLANVHSGRFSAAPFYNSATWIYSAFTLQQNLAVPIAGSSVAAIQFYYLYGDSGVDSAQVLYTDGSATSTTLPFVGSWTLEILSFSTTKQISGIRIVRSGGSGTNIDLDDFVFSDNPSGVSTSSSLLTFQGASQGGWASKFVRSSGTFSYPFYAEVQMSLSANPGSPTLDADFQLSPQATPSNGSPYQNPDLLRFIVNDGQAYVIVKCVGGPCTTVYNSGVIGGSLSVSWKIILTDSNTLTAYLNTGSGYSKIYSTTALGLSSNFAPSYAYLAFYNYNTALYSASFDYVGLSGSNSITVNGLQPGQRVELYDSNDVLQASGTASARTSGTLSVPLDATLMVFPYGYLKIYEGDGRTVQFVSPVHELWGGSTYSYTQPSRSGGITRTSTGFLTSSSVYVDDNTPAAALSYDGGDSWAWAGPPYAPVESGSASSAGISAPGEHQHYFFSAYPTEYAPSGYFHIQYVNIPSASVPSEVMVQFRDNIVSNAGFETGDFKGWSQSGAIIRADYVYSGRYSAAPSYNGNYPAFTLQQNFPAPLPGNLVTAVQLWYRWGSPEGYDSAQVLYSDGSYTQTNIAYNAAWTQISLGFDVTKSISGIKVVRSTTSGTNIVLDDFFVSVKGWEHRAYWGSNSITWGTDGTTSRRNMGPLPAARDSWVELIVKTDDVGTNGRYLDGLAYTLYNGGAYWDYSALGGPSTGTITFNGLLAGQSVELYDSGGTLRVRGTAPTGGSSITLDVYSAGINVFPFSGYLKVYSTSGLLQYSSPLMTDIWGGDVYTYNQPVFSNSFAYGFHDDFDYSTISQMTAAGWTVNGLSSHTTVGGGLLTLVNDGVTGANAVWTTVPAGVSDWTVALAAAWVGGNYGTLHLDVSTSHHSYTWSGDGYFSQYILYRDGQIVLQISGYTPQRNVWHTLRMDMRHGLLSLYFDGVLITTYTETDSVTNLASFGPDAGWESTDSFDFVDLTQVSGPGGSIHNALIGLAQHQTSTSLEEAYSTYDSVGNLVQQRQRYDSPTGLQWLTTSTAYDIYGNPTTFTDPRGFVTYNTYSAKYVYAFLTNQTRVNGSTQVTALFGYDPNTGNKLWSFDPRGLNTTYQYDVLGRVVRVNSPNGRDYVAYTYNDPGNYVDITNENSWKTRKIYDGLGRLFTVESFLGGTPYANQTTNYNWQNKIASRTDALGNTVRYQYDFLGRVVSTAKPDGNMVRQFYNDTALWVRYADESSNNRCNFYDQDGRLVSVIEYADSNCNPLLLSNQYYLTSYFYDELGNLRSSTTFSTPGSSTSNYLSNPGFETGDFTGWSQTGMIIRGDYVHSGYYSAAPSYSTSSGVGVYSAFTLQQNFPATLGSLLTSVQFWYIYGDPNGQDSVQVQYTDGTYTKTVLPFVGAWTLESVNFASTKQVTSIKVVRSAGGTVNIIFDDFAVIGSVSQSTKYSYDNLNRMTSTMYPDGTSESYTYDSNGNFLTKTDRKGVVTSYNYDALNRVTAISYSATTLQNLYTYDQDSNLVQLQSQNATISYSYDSRNRVVSETYTVDAGFDVSTSTSALTIEPGSTGTSTVTVASYGGFAGVVQLGSAASTSAITTPLSPSSLSVSAGGTVTSTLTITTTSTTPAGNYAITVWGTSAGLTRSASISVKVTDFSLSASTSSISIAAARTGSLTISASSLNGYTGSITLSISSGLPTCVTTSFNPNPAQVPSGGTSSSTLTLNVGGSCLDSTNVVSVKGIDSTGLARYVSFTLIISDFTLSVSPNPVGVKQSNTVSLGVTATSMNSYPSTSVTLSVSGLPSGVTTSTPPFSPNPLTLASGSSSSSTLTLIVGGKALSGTYLVTITGTDGTITRTSTLTLIIGSFAITPSPNPVSITPGSKGNVTLQVSPYIGTSDTLTLSVSSGLPACVTASFDTTTILLPNGGPSTLRLSIGSSCAIGSYSVTVSATGKKVAQTITFTLTIATGGSGGSGSGGGGSGPSLTTPPIPSPTIAITYTVRYTYNGELLNSTTYPDGLVVKYTYDGLGRVVTVSQAGSINNYAAFTYNLDNQLTTLNYGNGLVGSYSYDALSRPAQISLTNGTTTILSLSYSYYKTGPVSNVTGQVRGVPVNEQYNYDPLRRLTNATLTNGAATTTLWYEYDSLGNRILQSNNGIITNYAYSSTNSELTSSSTPGTSISYTYDVNGNLATKSITTSGTVSSIYSWDAANRLLKVTANGVTQAAYAYDGLGRRVESVEATTVLYAYGGTEALSEIVPGTATNDFIYASGLRIAKVSGITVTYYHSDALGSTRLVTSAAGTILFSDNYQPFGQDNGTPTCSSSCETYKFTGKPYSTATQLYYYYQRWYDSSIGRFISPDLKHGSLTNPQSFNAYIYVLDLPTILYDPAGESDCSLFNPLGCVQNLWNAGVSAVTTVFNTGVNVATTLIKTAVNVVTTQINTALNVGRTLLTAAVNLESLVISTVTNDVNWVVNRWNTDANFRTIVISAVIIGVVAVATGGLGLAATPIIMGALTGGAISGGFYAVTCSPDCSPEGALAHVMQGVALGALGGAVGPVAGAVSTEGLGLSGSTAVLATRGITAGVEMGAQYGEDAASGNGKAQTAADVGIAGLSGFIGAPDEVETGQSFKNAAATISKSFDVGDIFSGIGWDFVSGFTSFIPKGW